MSFSSISNSIRKLEEIILSLLLTSMIVLSCLQIILRQFFDSGLSWADPLLRHMVVWGGLLGAVLAVSQSKHITLDILSHFLPPAVKRLSYILTQLFSSIVCGVLTYASWLFLMSEMEFGCTQLLSIPSWCWNLVFPFSFAVMCLRYLIGTITTSYQLILTKPGSDRAIIK